MSAIYIMWLREIKRYLRSRLQVVFSLTQPAFYLLALGFGFGPVFEKAGNGSYMQFLAPGIVGMTVLLTSIFSGISMLFDRQFGFLKETLVAPVRRVYIITGRTLGGATVGMIQGVLMLVVCLIAGFRPQHWSELIGALGFVAMVAITFAAVGTTMGSIIKDMQGFQMIMNFMVMPMFFLSGALFPLSHLAPVLSAITLVDPLSYGVDGLRGTLIGQWHFSGSLDLAILGGVASVFIVAGTWFFSRVEI